MKIKYFALAGLLLSLLASNASACNFAWANYGDNSTRELIGQSIADHVPDKFCKFSGTHKIVIQHNSYIMRDMCAGHAIVSLRKKRSIVQQAKTFSSIMADTDCRSADDARRLAAEAALHAVDELMTNLSDAIKAEI